MDKILEREITVEDFMQICRGCLTKNNIILLESNYIDFITRIADIHIDLNEGLPKNICSECITKIREISTFIDLIKSNDSYLRQILEKNKRNSNLLDNIDDNISNNSSDDLNLDQNEHNAVIQKEYHTIKSGSKKEQFPQQKKKKNYGKHVIKCSECDKIFSRKSNFNLHLKSHGKDALYECQVCFKKFKYATNLKRHDNIVHKGIKPFKCDVCGKEFATLSRKTEHFHIHTGARPYVCNFCGLSFKKYSTHYAHEIRHKIKNGELPKSEKIPKRYPRKPPENPSELECEICQKLFSSKPVLAVHKQIHSGEKPFLCTECGKGFIRKNHLEVHARIHSGEKPYQCNDCGKKFRQPAVYRNHLMIHKNQRAFKCEVCQKSFIQLGHLQNHLKTHTGEKPYKCTLCGKAFTQNGNLKAHTRIHTNERSYRCMICFMGFYDSSALKKHKKIHNTTEIDEVKNGDLVSVGNSCS